MSSAASALDVPAPRRPAGAAVAGLVPPAASTVTTSASRVPSASSSSSGAARSEAAKIGTPTAARSRRSRRPGRARRRRSRWPGGPGRRGRRPAGSVGTVDRSGHRVAAAPPGRDLGRRLEPLAGEQHRVGQEGVQLREVLGPALGQVAVRLGGDADRHRRQLHQLGVRVLLAAEHHQRLARPRGTASKPACQVLRRAEDPDRRPGRQPRAPPAVLRGRAGPGSPRRSRHPTRGPRAGRCRRWTAARSGSPTQPRRDAADRTS